MYNPYSNLGLYDYRNMSDIHKNNQKFFGLINGALTRGNKILGNIGFAGQNSENSNGSGNNEKTDGANENKVDAQQPPPPPPKKEQRYKYWFLDFASQMVNARLVFGRFVYRHCMTKLHERIKSGVKQTLVIYPEDIDKNVYFEIFDFENLPVDENSDIKPYVKNMFKNLPPKFNKSGVVLSDAELEEIDKEIRAEYVHKDKRYQLVDTNCDAIGTASKTANFKAFKEYHFHMVSRTDEMSHVDYNMYRCIMTNIINYFGRYMNMPLLIKEDIEPDYVLPNDEHGAIRRFRVSYEYCSNEGLRPGEIVVGLATTYSFTEKKNVEGVSTTKINYCVQSKYKTADLFNDTYAIHMVMVHEMLHAFGFGHNPNILSIMTPVVNDRAIEVAVDPTIMSICDYHGLTLVYGCPKVQPAEIGEYQPQTLAEVKKKLNDTYYKNFFDLMLEEDRKLISDDSVIKKLSINRFYNNLSVLFDNSQNFKNQKYLSKALPIIFYLRNVDLTKIVDEIRIIEYLLPDSYDYGFIFTYDVQLTDEEYNELNSLSEVISTGQFLTNSNQGEDDQLVDKPLGYTINSYSVEVTITKDKYVVFTVMPTRLGLTQKIVKNKDSNVSIFTKLTNTLNTRDDQIFRNSSEDISEEVKNEEKNEIYNFHYVHKEQIPQFTSNTDVENFYNNLVVSPIDFDYKNVNPKDYAPLHLNKLPLSKDIVLTSADVMVRPYPFNNLDAFSILFPLN